MEAELLPKETALQTADATFAKIMEAANAQIEESKRIIVTDPTDVKGMEQSRKYRLALRQIRIAGDKLHKEAKAEYLQKGRAIDGMKNILLAACEPEEKRLLDQEELALRIQERREAEELEKRTAARRAELVSLGENPDTTFGVAAMVDDVWQHFFAGVRAAKAAKDAAAKADADRRQAEKEEADRNRAEVARLKAEADARESEARKEREAAAAALKAEQARAKAIEDAARAEAARIAQERAKQEAEARAKVDAEAAAKRKADAAPDREKLMAFAVLVDGLAGHAMESEQGRAVLAEILAKKAAFAAWIRGKAGEL